MKRSLKKISIRDLGGLVCARLKKHEVSAVLTGGACVTIFSKNKYQSLDLDFVAGAAEYNAGAIRRAMLGLGFKRAAEGFFSNKDCPYIVEFIPPPLAVGSEPVKNVITIRTRAGSLRLLSPTDCVKDRLAAFYHWDDPQSLEQALMVARRQKIDLKEIRRWSQVEGRLKKCRRFFKALGRSA